MNLLHSLYYVVTETRGNMVVALEIACLSASGQKLQLLLVVGRHLEI